MEITSVTSRPFVPDQDSQTFSKVKQSFQDLGKALESGNIADAKAALNTLTQNAPKRVEKGTNPMSAKMEALTKALDSGDVTAAKNAYADIKKAMSERKSGAHRTGGAGGSPPNGGAPKDAQKASGTEAGSDPNKVYDKADANKDGTVSWKEQTDYDVQHPDVSKANKVDSAQGLLDATA